MKRVVLFILLMVVACIATGFLLALASTVEPEVAGFFHRWLWFGFRYGIVAGVVAATLFVFVNRKRL